jgi:hypothetical protein
MDDYQKWLEAAAGIEQDIEYLRFSLPESDLRSLHIALDIGPTRTIFFALLQFRTEPMRESQPICDATIRLPVNLQSALPLGGPHEQAACSYRR